VCKKADMCACMLQGKLIIGHNMLLDICHVINQCSFPLPEDYSEFKEMVNCVFPKMLDTKYMSDLPVFKDHMSSNTLGHMYKTLSEEPFKMCIASKWSSFFNYYILMIGILLSPFFQRNRTSVTAPVQSALCLKL
jgi:hypothetical protein